jgi:type I restriction enzyme, S subunit
MSIATNSLNGYGTIPDHWEATLLPEVVFFQEGPGLRKWQWTESGMKVINVTNILGDGSVDTNNTSRFISMAEYEKTYRHFTVDAGDIVVASSGNTYGKVGRVSAKDLPLMMNTSVIRFHSSDPERLDDDFLYAFLRSEVFRNQVEAFVIGSAQPNFGPTHIKRMVMPLPPLPIQRRIAGIMSAYDELIENSQRRIKILESMARALYREWFVHFRFPGHESVPRIPSRLGEIPKGWEVKTVPDCVNINPRVSVPRDGEKPFVPMGCLSNDSMHITNIEARDGNSGAKFQNGDTLFARITPCLENGKTGFVQFLPDAQSVAFGSTEFIVLRSRTLTPEFVYLLARSDEFRGIAIKSMSGATGRQRVQEKCFEELRIAQPPRVLLDQFALIVSPSFRLTYKLHLQIQNLRRTRDLLLPRLLSGQIDVEAIAS